MSDTTNVQDIVADKVEAPQESVATEAPAATETAANETATTEPAATEAAPTESKTEEPATTEDKSEADIVAAAAKLADNAEKNDAEVAEAKAEENGHTNGHGRGGARGGRGGRGGFGNRKQQWRENYKSEFPADEKSDDPAEIRKQVEFYFSDSNLPNDKFLMKLTGGHENNAVPLDTICTFKRMRRFEPRSAVVSALKESEMVEVVEDDTAIKRKTPLEADAQVIEAKNDAAMRRSIYAKGFGQEEATTQHIIELWFSEIDPMNRSIRLRRTDFGKFKGSIFVEFETEEKAKEFLASEKKPLWKNEELKWMSKKEYCDMKLEEIRAGKVKPQAPHQGARGGNRGRGFKGRYPNGKTHQAKTFGNRPSRGKRQRDDDSGAPEPAAKKVDTGASA